MRQLLKLKEQAKHLEQQVEDIQTKWFNKASEVLRSVTCQQHYGGLINHSRDKFCALGAIFNYYGWNGYGSANNETDNAILAYELGLSNSLQWLSLSNVGEFIITLNDEKHLSFEEIADTLEKVGY